MEYFVYKHKKTGQYVEMAELSKYGGYLSKKLENAHLFTEDDSEHFFSTNIVSDDDGEEVEFSDLEKCPIKITLANK